MSLLCAQPWPGNVRQLENGVFGALVLAEGDEIGIDEFPQVAAQSGRPEPWQASGAPLMLEAVAAEALSTPTMEEARPVASLSPPFLPDMAYGGLSILDPHGDIRPLAEIESELIRLAIAHYDGQMSEVARKLRIRRSTLYPRLHELRLKPGPRPRISAHGLAAEGNRPANAGAPPRARLLLVS